MNWILQLPILVAMLIVAWAPGWAWLRVASHRFADTRVNTLTHIAIAPLITFALVTVMSVVFTPARGMRWSPSLVITSLLFLAVAGFIVDFFIRRGRRGIRYSRAPWRWDWTLLGVLTGSVVLASLPLLVFANPANPLQQWDPSFHNNGVWTIVHTGNANPLSALSPLLTVEGGYSVYYPAAWHGFTALFATPGTVVQTVNTSSLAVIIWWIVGIAGFANYLWNDRARTLIAAVLGSLTLSFPADFVSMYAQWPNATSMALLPGLLLLAWIVGNAWVRSLFSSGQWGKTALWTLVFVVAGVGAVGVHPISFFNALAVVVVPLSAAVWRLFQGARRSGRTLHQVLFALFYAGVVGVVSVIVLHPRMQATAAFERGRSWLDAVVRPFMPIPPFPLTVGLVLAIATFAVLLVLGLRKAWKTPRSRWLVGAWALFAVLVFLSYAPNFGLQFLTGPWYSDPRRIMGAMQVTMVLVFTLGVVWLKGWARQKWSMHSALPVLLVVALSGVGAVDARSVAVQRVYDPENLGPAGMASQAELDLFRSAGQILPEDALIIGDPSAGTVYFQALGGRRVVFPQLSIADRNSAINELTRSFSSIHDDPAVCQLVNELGITHFYQDADTPYYKVLRSETKPGFYGVDTSVGFKEVVRADSGVLYEITACTPGE
ncbi:MAG: hypothetical protein Q4D87_04470 [Actinomycetaceae bacterium]|nr:hypothetical protein [Actinomycetaceae bacterium]